MKVPCSICGTEVERRPNRVARFAHVYCSRACESVGKKQDGPRGESHIQHVPPVIVACDNCGAELRRQPSKVRQHNFCGIPCRESWQRTSGYTSGPSSATWRGGFDDYRGPSWNRQRRAALERDDHRCCDCGATKRLQVHHVRPWVTFETHAEANDLDNLRTLCLSCHKRAEWEYWREHPDMLRLYPDTRRVHTCRKCGRDYLARGHRSLDCDDCTTNWRRITQAPSRRDAHTPLPVVRLSGQDESAGA